MISWHSVNSQFCIAFYIQKDYTKLNAVFFQKVMPCLKEMKTVTYKSLKIL